MAHDMFQVGNLIAVIGDNEAHDQDVAGYNGVHRLNHCDEPTSPRFTFTEPHMGTMFKIVLYAPDAPTANRAAKAAFHQIATLDAIMSDYRATSELMQLCQKAGGNPARISDPLFYVLSRAHELMLTIHGVPPVDIYRIARQREGDSL